MMYGTARCVVPFRELQVCEHVQRKHRSNHQYAVINTASLMWKMECHSCTDKISVWRTFAPDVVQAAFRLQVSTYEGTTHAPAVKCSYPAHDVPIRLDLSSHGPPPARAGVYVNCADGMYCTLPT